MFHKKTLSNSIFFACILITRPAITHETLPSCDLVYDMDYDNALFADLDPIESAIFDSPEITPSFQVKMTPQDIITIIETIGGFALIQEPFFLHTNRLNKRSLLDNAFFVHSSHNPSKTKGWEFITHAFYLYTNRSFFTKDADHLSSYLALNEETLLEKIENTLDMFRLFNPNFEFDIRLVFSLFTNMTIEDRNSGFMFDATHRTEKSFFRIAIPWYYLERNFFLTNAEKKLVEQEFGAFDETEQEDFQKEHLVSDKFGVGDTRIQFGGELGHCRYASFLMGGQCTLPTAFKWFNGPKGSIFDRPNTLPTLDTDFLFDLIADPSLANQEKAFDIITDLATGALDRLAANLLDTPLGNSKHIGIGTFGYITLDLDEYIDSSVGQSQNFLQASYSVEYLFPTQEKRFFINKVNTAGFAARDFDDTKESANNLDFLTNELIARYYLRAFDAYIQPGIIIHLTGDYLHTRDRWAIHIGNDFWFQSQEKIHWIHAQNDDYQMVDVEKARGPLAYQNTLFGGIVYSIKRPSRTWILNLDMQTTYMNKGIGAPWGITVGIKTYF